VSFGQNDTIYLYSKAECRFSPCLHFPRKFTDASLHTGRVLLVHSPARMPTSGWGFSLSSPLASRVHLSGVPFPVDYETQRLIDTTILPSVYSLGWLKSRYRLRALQCEQRSLGATNPLIKAEWERWQSNGTRSLSRRMTTTKLRLPRPPTLRTAARLLLRAT
jgi:hypothetical protein